MSQPQEQTMDIPPPTDIKLDLTCQTHTTEKIERITLDGSLEKELVCIECLLNFEDPGEAGNKLCSVGEFIDKAAKFYDSSKKIAVEPTEKPKEFDDLIEREGEYMDALQKHIEKEKKLISDRFNSIAQELVQICNEKKDKYCNALDKQLMNFRQNFIYFERQVRKLYPDESTQDQNAKLYPTKEELVEKLQKLTNSIQLTALVKNIKQDFAEAKIDANSDKSAEKIEEQRRANLDKVVKTLKVQTSSYPKYSIQEKYSQEKLVKDLKEDFDNNLQKLYEMQSSIIDLTLGETAPNSKIITKTDQVALLKKWLKKDVLNLKLVYRATRDGFNGSSFHSKCDGKAETISVIKSKNGQKIFGGYLDKAWETKEAWIHSDKAFIFSLSNKKMYTMKATHEQYGAYGSASYGPSFGGGYDFHISGKNGGCLPYSYDFGDANTLCGGSSFTCDEIEVFQITKEPVTDGQPFADSGALNDDSGSKGGDIPSDELQKVLDYLAIEKSALKLIYKGSKDGMNPDTFHSKCDDRGPTIVFAKGPDGQLVGGYTTQSWNCSDSYATDYSAFVFNLQKDLFCPVSIGESAIFQSAKYGAYFGDDETLIIFKEQSGNKWNVSSNAYDCYTDGDQFSGGNFSFNPDEVEVYEVK